MGKRGDFWQAVPQKGPTKPTKRPKIKIALEESVPAKKKKPNNADEQPSVRILRSMGLLIKRAREKETTDPLKKDILNYVVTQPMCKQGEPFEFDGHGQTHTDKFLDKYKHLVRPAAPAVDCSKSFSFQQLAFGFHLLNGLPVINLYGITNDGNTVLCEVTGFKPYFFVPALPSEDLSTEGNRIVAADCFKRQAIEALVGTVRSKTASIIAVDLVKVDDLIGYVEHRRKRWFYKVTTANPHHLRSIAGHVATMRNTAVPQQTYESQLEFDVRFFTDTNIVPCGWIELPPGGYKAVVPNLTPDEKHNYVDSGQIHVKIPYQSIIAHKAVGKWAIMAPARVLSFDIECTHSGAEMPTPDIDPIIQISNSFMTYGKNNNEIMHKCIFVVKSCYQIEGVDVHTFATEQEMLVQWAQYVRLIDPDIYTGYNIQYFDFQYIVRRCMRLGLHRPTLLGRVKSPCPVKTKTVNAQELRSVKTEGRVQLDVLSVVQKTQKLECNTLAYVSARFLERTKADLHHSYITPLHTIGGKTGNTMIARYCVTDSELPILLINRLNIIANNESMARICGVQVHDLLTRGQLVRVAAQLVRYGRPKGYVMPDYHGGAEQDYDGARVLEPTKGYYFKYVATFDFSSLYPSIMQAHNLCYTTLVKDPKLAAKLLAAGEAEKTPYGSVFVRKEKRQGIIPVLLDTLLTERKETKVKLKAETDPEKKKILDAQQNALKTCANSVYGFTGASKQGRCPCRDIAASVTGYGQDMLKLTEKLVPILWEKMTRPEGSTDTKGPRGQIVTVIYGDTDSVMVVLGEPNDSCFELCTLVAKAISGHFPPPVNLAFEKIYYPFILLKKKMYAGNLLTAPGQKGRMDTKGIALRRRDKCKFVQKIQEQILALLMRTDNKADNIKEATMIAKEAMRSLARGELIGDIGDYIVSVELKNLDPKVKSPHTVVARQLAKADPACAPKPGDRIPFLVVEMGHKKGAAISLSSVHPTEMLTKNYQLNRAHYTGRLKKTIRPLLDRIHNDNKDLVNKIFATPHVTTIKKADTRQCGLGRWMKPKPKCLVCKGVIHQGNGAFCTSCQTCETPHPRDLAANDKGPPECTECITKKQACAKAYNEAADTLKQLETTRAQIKAKCTKCQGDDLGTDCMEITCLTYWPKFVLPGQIEDQKKWTERTVPDSIKNLSW